MKKLFWIYTIIAYERIIVTYFKKIRINNI